MNCSICKQIKVKNKDIFSCDGCFCATCKECGNLAASEVRVLQLTSRVMKFYCPKCLKGQSLELFQQLLASKQTTIDDKTTIIHLLTEELEVLKKKLVQKEPSHGYSYSSAVKKQKEEVIIIKPKDCKQASELTKKKIEETVNPCGLGIGVSRMKYIRDGGIAIRCNESKTEKMQSMCDDIKDSLGNNYEVNISEKKNPRIIVFNIDETELEDEDSLIKKVIIQNNMDTNPNERELKIVHNFKDRKGLINVILQLDVHSYECIQRKQKLYIGWKSCSFKDSVNVKQCYKCWKFGHLAKDCRKELPICQTCAGEHKVDKCQSNEVCCTNCKYASEVLKVPNIDYEHNAHDRLKCESYKRVVKELQEKIRYPEFHQHNGKM